MVWAVSSSKSSAKELCAGCEGVGTAGVSDDPSVPAVGAFVEAGIVEPEAEEADGFAAVSEEAAGAFVLSEAAELAGLYVAFA